MGAGKRWFSIALAVPVLYFALSARAQTWVPPNTADDIPRKSIAQWDAKARIYTPPQPDKMAAFVLGQRFIYLPRGGNSIFADAETGKWLLLKQTALHIVTLRRVESHDAAKKTVMMRFDLANYPHEVRCECPDDITKQESLHPILMDATVRTLRKSFLGKKIYAYPNVHFHVVDTDPKLVGGETRSAGQPALVTGIYRIGGYDSTAASHSGVCYESRNRYGARDPLLVVTKLIGGSSTGGSSIGYDDFFAPDRLREKQARLLGHTLTCADWWDFYHLFSPVTLKTASRHWSRAIRKTVREGNLRKGMTPDMLAWSMGWPVDYSTLAQFRRRAEWVYDYGEAGTFVVYFRHGRISGWQDNMVKLP